MDARNDEQTELLRNIWIQIKDLDHSLGRRIDKTNEVVAEIKAEMIEVKTDIKSLKAEMIEVKTDIREMKTDIREIKTDLKGLRADVDDLKVETKAIRIATQDGFALLARVDARQQSDLGELRARIERIEDHVGLR